MRVIVSNTLRIQDETPEFYGLLEKELTVANPEYAKRQYMGFYLGNTPKDICLFSIDGDDIVVPYGCLHKLQNMCPDAEIINLLPENPPRVDFGCEIPLYDYQEKAVDAMLKRNCGILQAPTGSGKTQMGIAIAARLGMRTLWLTHTLDLVAQSKDRAERYMDSGLIGTIESGKVEIGKAITFATVQTMSRLDLVQLRNTWDCIIVDECHRVAGTPAKMTMFSKVLNNLAAHYKFGLSATVHRADGLIAATFALMGNIEYAISTKEVGDKRMMVQVAPISLPIPESDAYRDSSGQRIWNEYAKWLARNETRNKLIADWIRKERGHPALILGSLVTHLNNVRALLPSRMQSKSATITCTTKKADRKRILDDMRSGKLLYLFSTYGLAKEGLDIPCLERLFFLSPASDQAVLIQSIGRIARTSPGKEQPIAFDFVDDNDYQLEKYKLRCRAYRRAGCELILRK